MRGRKRVGPFLSLPVGYNGSQPRSPTWVAGTGSRKWRKAQHRKPRVLKREGGDKKGKS